MNEKPRFEILERIGHGQFSNVYKARWINAPLTPVNTWSMSAHQDQSLDADSQPVNLSGPSGPLSPTQQRTDSPSDSSDFQSILRPNFTLSDTTNTTRTSSGAEKYVALKRIKFYDIQNSKLRMDCIKEVKLLQQLKHPNIINYNISFIERNELFIVLELADGGDLSKLIRYFQRRQQLLSQKTILKYFSQICSAVSYIHSKRILHRDIKPANIFMTSDGCVKLGDFGLGKFFSQNTLDAHSIVGTFYYMSPERICESGYAFSSDIWSLGCVLYELITLHSPFSILHTNGGQVAQAHLDNEEQPQRGCLNSRQVPAIDQDNQQHRQQNQNSLNLQWLIEKIVRADYPSLEPYNEISVRIRQLANECLNPNPEARPNMDYVCAVVGSEFNLTKQTSGSHDTKVKHS